ncbi:MAG: alcohol dehydrogenase catalytic domain-containing protein [Deltaproteobacteria bacterium]|jgi:threonine dehydrogenase-like Zn-dependent dehydrogenase|nr:alcohol dehydrogenase catalytic domain-containing protein [Deltaproteobacteria bacterium]
MKAVVYRRSTGLVVEEVPRPEPGVDGVLVKVANTGFCGSDHSLIESGLLPDGFILGHEISGIVVEKGEQTTGPKEGSQVIIRPTYCGKCRECLMGKPHLCPDLRRTIGIGDLPGAFAEYVKVFPQMLIPIPAGVDSRNAALAETFASALHGIKCSDSNGGSVLVMGGGPIGLASVQLLKLLGFSPIALSEPVKEKRDLAHTFGADYVLDPLREDLTPQAVEMTQGVGFETILECSGVPENFQIAFNLVAKCGTVCIVSIIFKKVMINNPMALNFRECRITGSYSNTHEDNIQCLQWILKGQIDPRPMITDLIPLDHLPRVYKERIHPGKAVKVMLQIGEEF